ncbi:MAG TPA: 5-(carboxyamino)imidazole ribonucleotide synthase [Alphaproteobacteria bacterium]|nr:5-(carboxyamino)imidazole ribonucleotide synthase [Alphaproteobacteria bacterium]
MTVESETKPGQAIAPGATIGIMGGGQLGRMTALAAAELGYRTHVFTPEANSPCAQVCAAETVAQYEDTAALDRFADAVDVVTIEFENVPLEAARRVAAKRPFHPSPDVLAVTQVRSAEKTLVNRLGFGTAPWAPVSDEASLAAALEQIGQPAILKSDRFGYDGKGQVRIVASGGVEIAAEDAWTRIGRVPSVLEGFVDFALEISVVLARGQDGQVACYTPVANRHVAGILAETIAPAAVGVELSAEAVRIAGEIARALDYVGVLAVEMFVTGDGRLLVNELAPRPHNSGHWTIDACPRSQFEQHVRAVCGLPLGSSERHSDATMLNLIGDDVLRWRDYFADPSAHLHLYGKEEVRPGRKMGHVTFLRPLSG